MSLGRNPMQIERTRTCLKRGREYTKCYINNRTFQVNELGTHFPHPVSGIGTRVSPCCLPGDCYPGHLPLEDDPCFNLHRISEAIKHCMKENSELVEEISRCTQKDDIKTLEKMNEILDDVIQDIHTELQSKRDQSVKNWNLPQWKKHRRMNQNMLGLMLVWPQASSMITIKALNFSGVEFYFLVCVTSQVHDRHLCGHKTICRKVR